MENANARFFLETAWADNFNASGKWLPKWERYPRAFKSLKSAVAAANRIESRSSGECVCRFIDATGTEISSYGYPARKGGN